MRSLLRAAANEWGWIKTTPVIKTKKPVSKRIRWLTKDEANRLIDCMPDSIRPVVTFALSTGLRRSNILDLEWTQVDMQGKRSRWVFVHTKAGTRPDGTKTPAVRKMRTDDNTAWRIGLNRAGITDFRFHDLRHTWASWLIQAGVPLSALQEMGGWESIEMVQRYAHLAPNHLTGHARQIDSILGVSDTNTTQGRNQAGFKIA